MAFSRTGGARVFFSPTAINTDALNALSDSAAIAQFTAISNWIEIGEVENMGEVGDSAEEISFIAIANNRVRKIKGAFNAGDQQLICGRDPLDLGQIALITALASNHNFSFRISLNDIGYGMVTASRLYYAGMVMAKPTNIGENNNVTRRQFNIALNSAAYEIYGS